jgi:hypothetical protein
MYLQNNVSRFTIILFCFLLLSFSTALADTDLSVSITDLPDSIIPGQDITLNLRVMNNGPSPASNPDGNAVRLEVAVHVLSAH